MSGKLICILFAISYLSVSCGKKKEQQTSAQNIDRILTVSTHDRMMEKFNASSVVCGEPNKACPNNVVKLTFWERDEDGYGISVCSGTYINEDYVLTNSHCIPHNLKYDGADCSKQIKIQFPETQMGPAETISCQDVVQSFNHENDEPDIAVLKVSRSSHSRLKSSIKADQLFNKGKLTAYTMNPNQEKLLAGTITKKECDLSTDNLMTYKADANSKNGLILGERCNVISGNAGSGAFDQDGNLVALVYAKYPRLKLKKFLQYKGIKHDPLTYLGLVVNIGCLESLTEANGYSCKESSQTFTKYINQKVYDFGLDNVSNDHIEVKVTGSLELKLKEVNGQRSFFQSLTDFMNGWQRRSSYSSRSEIRSLYK